MKQLILFSYQWIFIFLVIQVRETVELVRGMLERRLSFFFKQFNEIIFSYFTDPLNVIQFVLHDPLLKLEQELRILEFLLRYWS